MSTEVSDVNTSDLNLDVILYLEAPDSLEETESGKLILTRTKLQLPGDIDLSLRKLKNAKYEKLEDRHVIKITTTSENELYFGILNANKAQLIKCIENINDSIQNSDSLNSNNDYDKTDSPSPRSGANNNDSPIEPALTMLPQPQTSPIQLEVIWRKSVPYDRADIGIQVTYFHQGTPSKTIKRIKTTFQAIDSVNEPVGEIRTFIFTGPLDANNSKVSSIESFFFGNEYINVTNLKITKIDIIYMDNTCISIEDSNKINAMMKTNNTNNGCAGCAGIILLGISIPAIISLLFLI